MCCIQARRTGIIYVFFFFWQTVEKWTLREIQEKMHSGGGIPSLSSKSSSGACGSNPSSSSGHQSVSSSEPPPPIPARRLASHPPITSSGKMDAHQQGLCVKEKDVSESHSAPSSPTEKATDGSLKGDENCSPQKVSPRHSSRSPNYQRPKSVVVDMTTGLNYAQVQFANGHNVGGRPKASQRRNTKYTSIAYQPENAKKSLKEDADGHGKSDGGHYAQDQARQQSSPPSTASRNSDHHHHHFSHSHSSPRGSPVPTSHDGASMYDLPPPIPMRMDLQESNEGGMVGGGDKLSTTSFETVHKRHSSDPFHGGVTDPFAVDPFGGDSAWNDPSAFYDKPPSRQPIPARSEPPSSATASSASSSQAPGMSGCSSGVSTQLPSSATAFDDNVVNSSDFTGESSYEDTFEVLQNLQKMKSGDPYAPASVVYMGQDGTKVEQTRHQQGHNETSSPELNQLNKDSYEFPTELAKYPMKRGEPMPGFGGQATMPVDNQPQCVEEPTLHTFNYSPKLPHNPPVPPPPSSSSSSSGSSVTRHESFSRSSRNMPLPPIPTEMPSQQQQQQSPWQPPHPTFPVDHAPPLPARTVPNSGKPPLPGNHPSMRKAATPASDEQPPRLPPPNHPWGNKRHPSEPADSAGNPPLPPRKKEGPSVAETPGAAPSMAQQQTVRREEFALRELLALGYSKAEIDRALKITRNDYAMAKMILQEFGGRH